jgi:hypothetical protein
VVAFDGMAVRTSARAVAEDWLGKWAMNLILINVSTRKFRRGLGTDPVPRRRHR